jgi:hypothetical protein
MKAFRYNGVLYLRCIPAKSLFHSSMVHEVVNRGDVFALDVATQKLTIIPGTAQVEHLEAFCAEDAEPVKEAPAPEQVQATKAKIKQQRDDLAKRAFQDMLPGIEALSARLGIIKGVK